MADRLDVREFLAGYLAEADDLVRTATARLLELDEAARSGAARPRAVREVFRALHTLKGLSAMVGASAIADLTHEMESVLRDADRAGGRLAAPAVDLLLRGIRAVEERLGALGRGETVPPAPADLVDALSALHVETDAPLATGHLELDPELEGKLSASDTNELLQALAAGRRAVRVDFVPSPERAAEGLSITSVRERVGKLGSIVKVVPLAMPRGEGAPAGLAFALLVATEASNEALAAAAATTPATLRELRRREPPAGGASPPAGETGRAAAQPFVRVDVARLDDALTRLSSLIVSRFRLERAVADLAAREPAVRELVPILAEASRHIRDLREAIMRARLVRVSDLLERAPLVVRGASRASGKLVRLEVQVGDAELDKDVGDRLLVAVVHLLRNAVDHAIERPDERRAAGKPEEGRILVECRERGTIQLELAVSDDGRGIDRERLARQAGAPVPATDAELLDLVTRAGVSGAQRETQTSGRGMGMDIVRRVVIDELGGELRLATEPGRGTTFTARVPLSLTIVEVFSFACGGEQFVVPVSGVDDLAEIDPGALVAAPAPRGGDSALSLLRHRGHVIPLVALARVLDLGSERPERRKAIIVRLDGGGSFAFEVDRLLGRHEAVVRPVRDPLATAPGVSGATDLGDGRPTLVLDLTTMARRLSSSGRDAAA